MITQPEPYNATQRYFRCADMLEAAERARTPNPRRIERLKSWCDMLCTEASTALVDEVERRKDSVDAMFVGLKDSFTVNPSNN